MDKYLKTKESDESDTSTAYHRYARVHAPERGKPNKVSQVSLSSSAPAEKHLTPDQLDAFEERAAIIEFDSRPRTEPTVPRSEAEQRAAAVIINRKGDEND